MNDALTATIEAIKAVREAPTLENREAVKVAGRALCRAIKAGEVNIGSEGVREARVGLAAVTIAGMVTQLELRLREDPGLKLS